MTTYQVRWIDLSEGKFYEAQLGPHATQAIHYLEKMERVQILSCEKAGVIA